MLRRTLLASASAMVLTGVALAADLTPVPPPVFSWNGFYAGVNVGADIPSDSFATIPGATLISTPFDGSTAWGEGTTASKVNFMGGGQIGYNWQPLPWMVLGLETDIQGTTAKDNINNVFFASDASGSGTVADKFSGHRSWFGTVRGRVGFTLNSYPQLMIYATGGLAYGESSRSASTTTFETDGDLAEFFPYGSTSKVNAGYTVGGGVEWAFMPNWSVKAEYLFVKLPSDSAVAATTVLGPGALPSDIMFFHHSAQDNIVRLGLNYRFNWWVPGPVVAKY
jgi:opacity protein-like surface antigen